MIRCWKSVLITYYLDIIYTVWWKTYAETTSIYFYYIKWKKNVLLTLDDHSCRIVRVLGYESTAIARPGESKYDSEEAWTSTVKIKTT